MSHCEVLTSCIFFNDKMKNKPGVSVLLKKRYCLGENSKCGRYIVLKSLGREYVPNDLFPSDVERVSEIVLNVEQEAATV